LEVFLPHGFFLCPDRSYEWWKGKHSIIIGFYLISQDLRQGINFPPQDERVAPKTERRKQKEKK
jgi:hypothetical protein